MAKKTWSKEQKDEALRIAQETTAVEAEKQTGIPAATIRSWLSRMKNVATRDDENVATLQRKQGRRGAPNGNQNALGNRGNPNPKPNFGNAGGGAKEGNGNSIKTWEHANLAMRVTDAERAFLDEVAVGDDPATKAMNYQYGLMLIRLDRMMWLYDQLMQNEELSKQVRVLKERQKVKEMVQFQGQSMPVERHEMVQTQHEEISHPLIDKLIPLEDAITRLQDKILKTITSREKMQRDLEMLAIAKERLELDKTRLEWEVIKSQRGDSGGDESGDVIVSRWQDEEASSDE